MKRHYATRTDVRIIRAQRKQVPSAGKRKDMTREEEIARITEIMEKRLGRNGIHRLYIAAMTFFQMGL